MADIGFRKDVNGLRALAVVGVLLFHFMPGSLTGGYAGVDVFFVISGYLMTAIIYGGLQKGTFSVWHFYLKRANRIVPALAVLCLAMLLAGWFFLEPSDYRTVGLHVASSVSFLSNMVYWQQADYFDSASHEKWLLHTWSLSVEWQFYIIFPLIALILARYFTVSRARWILAGLAVLSLGASWLLAVLEPVGAFYLFPSRAWEMILGGLVFLFALDAPPRLKPLLTWGGLVLIILSYVLVDAATLWPAPVALLPTFGTFCVIVANSDDSPLSTNPVMQWLGRISYSLYLWHWPVVVLGNYLQISRSPWFIAGGLAASLALGHLSYTFVEQRMGSTRKPARSFGQFVRAEVLMGAVVVGSLGLAVLLASGFSMRADQAFARTIRNQVMPTRSNGYCFYSFNKEATLQVSAEQGTHCLLGSRDGPPRGLLFGDSYAGQYEPFWDQVGRLNTISINSVTTNWCYPSLGDEFITRQSPKARAQCRLNREHLRDHVRDYGFVVLAGHWSAIEEEGRLEDVLGTIRWISNRGVPVIIMPSPILYDTDAARRFRFALFNQLPFAAETISREKDGAAKRVNRELQDFAATLPNVHFLDRKSTFGGRETYRKDGVEIPYTLDGGHISMEGAIAAAEQFAASPSYRELSAVFRPAGAGGRAGGGSPASSR